MTNTTTKNITFHGNAAISLEKRQQLLGQKGITLWFTGLSGSGKSTIAVELETRLLNEHKSSYRLDGDNLRFGLNKDLGFSPEDRQENIRRVGEVAKLFNLAGVITLASFISPYEADRQLAREIHEKSGLVFIEIFVDVPLEVAESRDPKGLYKKAREGIIKEFTGISAPYEKPKIPEIYLDTGKLSIEESVEKVLNYIKTEGYLSV